MEAGHLFIINVRSTYSYFRASLRICEKNQDTCQTRLWLGKHSKKHYRVPCTTSD